MSAPAVFDSQGAWGDSQASQGFLSRDFSAWLNIMAIPLATLAVVALFLRRPHTQAPQLAYSGVGFGEPRDQPSMDVNIELPTFLQAAQASPGAPTKPKSASGASRPGIPLTGAGAIASAATIAAQEVSKAVSKKTIQAPELDKSFIAIDGDEDRVGKVDEFGLPLVYDKTLIQQYWEEQGGALQDRWNEFLATTVPFLTRIVALGISGGSEAISAQSASLAKDARQNIERLGPTYIKMGQMLSVRPDVLPQEALDELAILQDSVKAFPTETAIAQIESELGKPLGDLFTEISEEPVAAASLAQVYKAVTLDGRTVAVKVQRPGVLELVSKDLYVLRRAAEVYQGLIERFAPQQRTDYIALLNEWAVGFYTELDFTNEGRNQIRLKKSLLENGITNVYVPEVYMDLCSRRILVTEWIDGTKLSLLPDDEIRELVGIGQEAFLMQLLQIGFFHSDPHPGNLMKMHDSSKGRLALLDCGLMAEIGQEDMDTMVSSIIHLSNKDYKSLVDDFIKLQILPEDCNRAIVEPLMDKALTPYVKGGGAKVYEEELKKMYGMDGSANATVGGFQQMTNDVLTVLNDIPFSIPPYMALLARAVVTLEGIALKGNPNYGIVTEAYPFVARKLLREDRPEIQSALAELLYGGTVNGGQIKTTRLAVVLNSAMGVVARTGGAFVDFDTIPDESVGVKEGLHYLLSPSASSLRTLIEDEAVTAADLLLRQLARRGFRRIENTLAPPSFLRFLPNPTQTATPLLLPTASGTPVPAFLAPSAVFNNIAPSLTQEEEVYAISLVDLAKGLLGEDVAKILTGDAIDQPQVVARLLLSILTTGRAIENDDVQRVVDQVQQWAEQGQAGAPAGNEQLAELQEALDSLGPEERQVLQDTAQRLFDKLWQRVLDRTEGLLPNRPSSPAPALV
uniref:ABC1 atypical kinase-like domain-containing protein n=1 Tax=Eutreptiella gymnastica TaxID=73025 RepID=A0A7S1I4E1_9EUGL